MSPALAMAIESQKEKEYQKGVKHLCENGVTKVPHKYILPFQDRPTSLIHQEQQRNVNSNKLLKLPVIDFAELLGPNRSQVLKSLSNACEEYGFFQLVNHDIGLDVITNMIDVGTKFFALPFDERAKYMTADMRAPIRYGTSFNQTKDKVFCWRDFLKLLCQPNMCWPSSPIDFRKSAETYAKETKDLFTMLMEAILESLGVNSKIKNEKKENIIEEFRDGSQLMVVNCYPPCPEPDLTLGMPAHSDYGFLTLLLQDEVAGLQIQHKGQWFTLEPKPNSFVVNVGDHLEIFSNGRYKSVLHRVLVNSMKDRISVASLHSMGFETVVGPSPNLIDDLNPKRYEDTDFASFLKYHLSCDSKEKSFLETRKIDLNKLQK